MGLPDSLIDESNLTPRQLEALQGYIRVALGEMKYREAASIASSGRRKGDTERPLTVGSYFRTVQQARDNIRKSIVTLLIGLWLGVVKAEDVKRLLDTAGRSVGDLSEEEKERFAAVLRALLQKIVM